ncbi:hypothetical protein AMELA_G00095390, partial [Ameiurus melas]
SGLRALCPHSCRAPCHRAAEEHSGENKTNRNDHSPMRRKNRRTSLNFRISQVACVLCCMPFEDLKLFNMRCTQEQQKSGWRNQSTNRGSAHDCSPVSTAVMNTGLLF